jgi:ribosome-binding factor A
MTIKQERMGERIREILSDLLLFEVKDPRLGGVTVTEVQIDREVQFAEVYVNAMGDEERQEEVMEALESAKGFLRREVGGRIHTRRTPVLRFKWDNTFEHAERVGRLLDSLDIPPETPDEAERPLDDEFDT